MVWLLASNRTTQIIVTAIAIGVAALIPYLASLSEPAKVTDLDLRTAGSSLLIRFGILDGWNNYVKAPGDATITIIDSNNVKIYSASFSVQEHEFVSEGSKVLYSGIIAVHSLMLKQDSNPVNVKVLLHLGLRDSGKTLTSSAEAKLPIAGIRSL